MSLYATDCYSSGTGVTSFFLYGESNATPTPTTNNAILYIKSNSTTYYSSSSTNYIYFDTIYDVNINFDGTTYTVPETGYYSYTITGVAAAALITMSYRLNGNDTIMANSGFNGFGVISMTASDTLSFVIRSSSGSGYWTTDTRVMLYKI